MTLISRSGYFVKQTSGYKAFIPAPLPPVPPLAFDAELTRLLSGADQAMGRLDVISEVLPNPDLFVGMFVRQEAVLSSQIEGTQSTLEDVLQLELFHREAGPSDAGEVVNCVAAMNHGLKRLEELPLSLRLLREIHAILMRSGRGSGSTPGEFRRTQNWIGPPGSTIETAVFVPPPVPEMKEALGDLEKFLHDEGLPVLVQAGLAHVQFETIHPFLDGNGRIGRLLVTFLLCQRRVLRRPVLYLSHYFKRHRAEYYNHLTMVRERGDWEGWLRFFLGGVVEVAEEAVETARRIRDLRGEHVQLLAERLPANALASRLLDLLLSQPYTTVRTVQSQLGCAYNTANKLVMKFVALGILEEPSPFRRNRVFVYERYLELFSSRRNK